MPSYRLAKSLETLRDQVNAAYPNRSKKSDGWIGDVRHQKAGTSDHLPNKAGVVTAIDITNDPANGLDSRTLAENLVASRDERIKYIISDGQIVSSKQQPWKWRKYTGANGHFHHVHISVMPTPALYDGAGPWQINSAAVLPRTTKTDEQQAGTTANTPQTPPAAPLPILRKGDKGQHVRTLQLALIREGFTIKADGDFGSNTELAVKGYQAAVGLKVDGVAGPNTYRKLGL